MREMYASREMCATSQLCDSGWDLTTLNFCFFVSKMVAKQDSDYFWRCANDM